MGRYLYHTLTSLRVIDGDTVEVDIDYGMGLNNQGLKIRIVDFDAPESRSYSGHHASKAEKTHARAAKAYAVTLLGNGENVTLETFKGQTFSRWLGKLTLRDRDGADFGALMEDAGMAKRALYEEDETGT